MESYIRKIYILAIFLVVAFLFLFSGFLFFERHNINTIKKQNSITANQITNLLPSQSDKANSRDEQPEKIFKMVFFGDLMIDRNVGIKIKQKGLPYLFQQIRDSDLLKNRDIASCNLEGAVTNGGQHYPPNNEYDFAFSPEITSQLKDSGINFLNLANNHFFDQGERGVAETKQNLDLMDFNYSGCPDGQIGECSSKIIDINGQKIGLVGFSAVYKKIDQVEMNKIISDAAGKTDFLIVNFHWGAEYQHKFGVLQQEIAHNLIDAGADIIIGHHPHVVQGIEIYNGKPIFYSLGNFVFDQYFSVDTQQGLAVILDLNRQKAEFSFIPTESKQSQPSLMEGEAKADFFSKLAGWSGGDVDYIEQIKSGKLILER